MVQVSGEHPSPSKELVPMSRSLTPRQQECLHIIEESLRNRGVSPSIREIGRALGVVSTSGVSDHLRALQKKGYLKRYELIARGLIPLAPPELTSTPPSNDGTHNVPRTEPSHDLAQQVSQMREQLEETKGQLEDAQSALGRKERRIERLEMLLAETRQALRDANQSVIRS
jgi:SOS-response transcriptional repressor LexA